MHNNYFEKQIFCILPEIAMQKHHGNKRYRQEVRIPSQWEQELIQTVINVVTSTPEIFLLGYGLEI